MDGEVAAVVAIVVILVLTMISFVFIFTPEKNDENDNKGGYIGDYDGGHNKTNSVNNNQIENQYKQVTNEELKINNNIMYDLRTHTISSTNPCLIVYLIDQSGSMDEKFGNAPHSKAVELANAINDTIYEVGLRCIGNAGELKNRFEMAIIGYGKSIKPAWEGQLAGKWVVSIKNVFEYPLGVENDRPIWIKPYAIDGTPMTGAFENAKRLCSDWINWGNHRDCHPPIIINITDGEATDSGGGNRLLIKEVEQIKQLRTNYGTVNILNIHISEMSGDRILFPNEITRQDKYANLLFEMSTPLNENMMRIARQKEYNIQNNARGYVFNGSANDLMNFLNIGTPQ